MLIGFPTELLSLLPDCREYPDARACFLPFQLTMGAS